MPESSLYGLMAEFATPQEVLAAARRVRAEGYGKVEAYTPYPVEGLATALGEQRSYIPVIVFVGAVVGAGIGYLMQDWSMAVDYPFDVGGRPDHSWPAFIPIAFEVMVLVAALSAIFGMIFLNGLPRLYRPVFNVPGFALATQERFFLCIEATDPHFDRERTRQFLAGLNASEVVEVPE